MIVTTPPTQLDYTDRIIDASVEKWVPKNDLRNYYHHHHVAIVHSLPVKVRVLGTPWHISKKRARAEWITIDISKGR